MSHEPMGGRTQVGRARMFRRRASFVRILLPTARAGDASREGTSERLKFRFSEVCRCKKRILIKTFWATELRGEVITVNFA